jgi:hypothetical protein
MATITQRPSKYSAVGGFLKNPIEYTVSSVLTFETISVKDSAGITLFQLRATVRSGFAVFDISKPLQSYLQSIITVQSNSYTDSNFIFQYYITGTGFDDTANRRYVVNAKVDILASNFEAFVAGLGSNAKFTNLINYCFEGKTYFLSIVSDSENLYLSRENFDINGNIISESFELIPMNLTSKYFRLLIPFLVAVSSCNIQLKAPVSFSVEKFTNPSFYDPILFPLLQGWTIGATGSNIDTAPSGEEPRLNCSGGGTQTFKTLSQNVYLQKGRYKFKLDYIQSGGGSWNVYFIVNGVYVNNQGMQLSTFLGANEYIYNNTSNGIKTIGVEIRAGFAVSYVDLLSFSFLQETYVSSEIKQIEFKKECYQKHLTWVNPLGGFEIYGFTFFGENSRVVSTSDYLAPNARQKTVLEKGLQTTMDLAISSVPKKDLEGLQTLLTSKAVYLIEQDNSLTPVVLTSNDIASQNSKEELYDINVTIELPFQNS